MKIYFLGTCCGTEPMKERNHVSTAIESNGRVYFFDAGEGCAKTAHLAGCDLLSCGKIVISHSHGDHVCGLGGLLWHMYKLTRVAKDAKHKQGHLDVYTPCMETWEGQMMIMRNTEFGFRTPYTVEGHYMTEGLVFDDGVMRVTAFPNTHMIKARMQGENDPCLSYSFLIEVEGKRIVYSGDVGGAHELDAPIGEKCDALIVETGHFSVEDIRDYVADKNVERVFFTHNSRAIINDYETCKANVFEYFGENGTICNDGMVVEF